ncbi:MAG: DUF3592 domain-containing protein [Pyrinomonadaceae bacterium]
MEAIFAGAFGLLLGAVGLWTGFRQLRNRAALERWHTTPGRVIERGTFIPSNVHAAAPAFRHAPLVKYTYEVGGRQFVNDSINPKRIQLPSTSSLKWAERRAASFADEVTVRYNPQDPAESFLVQTPKRMLYLVIAASCFALLFGAFTLLTK